MTACQAFSLQSSTVNNCHFCSMVLVTGATGLLGSQLLFDLLQYGYQVRAFRRNESDLSTVEYVFRNHPELLHRLEWMEGDVLDIFSLQDALKGIEHVYHCAAFVSFDPRDAGHMIRVNIKGTANVVNEALAAGVKKLCHVSSVAAINRIDSHQVIHEDIPWKRSRLHSNYAISKHGAEAEVWRAVAEGLQAVIVNPSIILGPGQWDRGSAAMFRSIYRGFPFYASGTSGFVDVRDVSGCMIKLMQSEINSDRFIISSENLSYRKVFGMIAKNFGKAQPRIKAGKILRGVAWRLEVLRCRFTGAHPFITRETARSGGMKVAYSNKKIRHALMMDFIPVEQAVERTCRAFREMHGWWS